MRYLAVLLVLAMAIGAAAQTSVPADNGSQQFWLVEFNTPPTSDGGNASSVQKDKNNFRNAAAAAKISFTERKSFDTLWNGMSIQATAKNAAALGNLSGVKAVYPDAVVSYDPQGGTGELDMINAVTMTGADKAQSELGLTGAGVKVAVIDTGLDYHHPDLGNCAGGIGAGCRVAKGYDLVGDMFNADPAGVAPYPYNPVPAPDLDPMDCAGHGSHVAGIIGANGDPAAGHVRGVAPGVTFYAYRVFGCSGSTLSSVMIDAMEHALNDGAQVVNMSIGSAYTWPQYPTATASDRLVKRGVVVVASFGNSGPGLFSGGAPGLGQDVIGVASFDNIAYWLPAFTVNGTAYGYFAATGAPNTPTTGTFPLARTGTTSSAADACTTLPAGSLAGQVALIRRGTCSFYIKASNAQIAGAAGVILYNNAPGVISPTVAGSPAITIPVVAITAADGATLDALIAGAGASITWTDQLASVANTSSGGLVSSFSSMGLSPDLAFKPDIGAPGGSIRSTYPLALGGYAVLSGTSMASPHVAGAVALLLEANPKLQARKVRDVLQNSAVPHSFSLTSSLLDGVWNQGAGMLDIYNAVLASTRITPGKLSLGESAEGPVTRTLTFTNNSTADVTYNLSFVDGLSAKGNFTVSRFIGGSNVAFSANPITIPAGGQVSLDATITAPAAPANALYGGWIVATPTTDSQTLRVPFGGFIGDFQSVLAMAPTANGFPWLARFNTAGTSLLKESAGAVFTLASNDQLPQVLIHFDQQVQQIQLQVTDPVSGRNWQYIDNSKYIPRNSTATGYYRWTFDGTTATPSLKNTFTVPNGQYIITVRALKALGNPDNPADWETWTSPVFTIARP